MADNLTTTTTVATIPSGTRIAAREVTYSGDANSYIAPVGLVIIAGSDDAKTATDVSNSSPVPVSDAGSSLTVDNGGTFVTQENGAALTALQLIDNIVLTEDAASAGGEQGVMLLAVRRDSASSGVSADGDFAALSVTSDGSLRVSGSAGTTQYSEDAVAASGDALCVVGAVRRDTPSSGVSADGDYAALSVDSNGALRVVNGGTSSVFVDDAAFTPAVSSVSVVGAQCDETGTDSVDEGDAGALRMTADRQLYVKVGTALPAGTNNIGDVDILSIAAGDNNIGNVDVVTLPNVTLAAGTNTNEIVGDAAHDAAVAGNPVRVGARAETALSGITLVADGDTTDLYAGVDGVLIVRPHANLEDVVQERTTNTDGASTAFASGLAAPGANIRLCICTVTICNSSATFCTVDLRDGSAGSVLWTFPVPATGGVTHTFNPPLKLTANTALAFDASAATTTLTISANGFKTRL